MCGSGWGGREQHLGPRLAFDCDVRVCVCVCMCVCVCVCVNLSNAALKSQGDLSVNLFRSMHALGMVEAIVRGCRLALYCFCCIWAPTIATPRVT